MHFTCVGQQPEASPPLHPIHHPINLSLLKPLEHHSTIVPRSDMQGFGPMSDINPFFSFTLFPPPSPYSPSYQFATPETPQTSQYQCPTNTICRDLSPWAISPIPPSIHSLFSYHQHYLIVRFLLSWKIVNTIIFWFDLTRSLKFVCRELYLPVHIPLIHPLPTTFQKKPQSRFADFASHIKSPSPIDTI